MCLDVNVDVHASCWVLLLFGICSVTVLNSSAREAHRLIFILRADGKNKGRYILFFIFNFCLCVYICMCVCVESQEKGLIQNCTYLRDWKFYLMINKYK